MIQARIVDNEGVTWDNLEIPRFIDILYTVRPSKLINADTTISTLIIPNDLIAKFEQVAEDGTHIYRLDLMQ